MLENKLLELVKIHTDQNVPDIMTKVVTKDEHGYYTSGVKMVGTSYVT